MSAIKLRLTGFALAIVLVALMIAWAAHYSWQKVAQLRDKLTSVQIASFQTADYFQAHLQNLDYNLLRYQARHELADRQRFMTGWTNLNEWIDIQKPTLPTPREKEVLNKIDAAYDDYYAAATNMLQNIDRSLPNAQTDPMQFEKVENQSRRLLELANDLVAADRQSLNTFLADSQKSLGFLRGLIFGSLFLLLALGAWLAGVVYREMINPLRMKLVESHLIIERQEKLASLGVLAAGVAHEIRNPLTAIKARLYTQQKALKSGSPELGDAIVIGNEINRLELIVRDVLEFARPSEPKLKTLSVAKALAEVRDLLAPQLEKNAISLTLETADGAVVKADPLQLKQVLINLVQNAAESIGKNGQIILRERLDNARLGGQVTPVVILEIADTGKGITPEVQKRLFDPFFSTKETGTGLGLSIAARIIEKHGGALEFQTQVDHGTTFGILLPQSQPS
ncbi:MAG: Signal transduction histidine kinase, nitrogen specific, NtrB [Pedosphaera sp.]|nr:Signal transduction histidine kinase, nitrogen specific, NtrB [Pedosphaera sp.]